METNMVVAQTVSVLSVLDPTLPTNLVETEGVVYAPSIIFETDNNYINQDDENFNQVLDLQNTETTVNDNQSNDKNNNSAFDMQSANIETVVEYAIEHMVSQKIDNPVEMLRYLQSFLVTGRQLDMESIENSFEGETS